MQDNQLPFELPGFELTGVQVTAQTIIVKAQAVGGAVACPRCGKRSAQVHSWYVRHPADLPSSGRVVRLEVRVRRLFCRESSCPQRTFAEPLTPVLKRRARRTERLTERLWQVGMMLGGEGGARLAARLGMPSSPDSLLRLVRQGPLAVHPPVRILGVDDWAWRKGHRYGSLLCDLERHRVIDLLPDRERSTFVNWLQVHPGIAIISRDRAGAYAEGATQGAPMALQVADRFHLVKNLADCVQRVLQRHRSCLVLQADPLAGPDPISVQASSAIVGLRSEKKRLANRARRVTRYQQILSLRQQGWTIERIAQQVGVSRNTINRTLRLGHFPERRRRRVSTSQALAPYMTYLDQRWAQGCHNATQLWREISAQGFTHGPDMVYRYAVRLRNGLPIASSPASIKQPLTRRRYSPRQAAFLFIRPPDHLQPQEAQDLAMIRRQCPDAQQAYDLAQAFVGLVHRHQPDALESWLTTVDHTALPDLQAFAAGIRRDKAAVLNGLALPWSTAQVEGQINRLKLLKRQMYGRAHFDLLRQRVLTPL